jgi:squalene synthase HpnC
MRPHVAAVYAFARVADDVADEGTASPDARQAELLNWQQRLHDAVTSMDGNVSSGRRDDLIVAAVAHSIRSLDLPLSLFDDLLSAFGQDTTTTRYDSWRDVLDYCRRSANPIGRLVLRIAGIRNEALDRSSDALCTALQLTNFWQDFGRDWRSGRLYVPREVQVRCGVQEGDLEGPTLSRGWTEAIGACADKTTALFAEGRPVCDGVKGRLKFELRLTWLGGRRVLDRVRATGVNLLHHRPSLGAADAPMLLWRAARWRRDAA